MGVIKNIIVLLLIVGAIFFGFRLLTPEDSWICEEGKWVQHGNPSSPIPQTPCEIIENNSSTTSSDNQEVYIKEYKNTKLGFSVKLPFDIDTAENLDGSVSFTKWGPTQKTATELFDGISINIIQGNIGENIDLKSVIEADIEQKKQQFSSDFSLLNKVTQINNGYYYQSKEMFGEVEYYYLSQSNGKYLLISVVSRDPGKIGFEKIVTDTIADINMIN